MSEHEPPSGVCQRCGGDGVDPDPSGVCHCGDSADHDPMDAGHMPVEMDGPCLNCHGKGLIENP